MYNYGFYFGQPWWLLGLILLVPIVWLARRNLTGLTRLRRWLAIVLRCLVILILVLLLTRPTLTRKSKHLTVIVVFDRSQSISQELQDEKLKYLVEKNRTESACRCRCSGIGKYFYFAFDRCWNSTEKYDSYR